MIHKIFEILWIIDARFNYVVIKNRLNFDGFQVVQQYLIKILVTF